MLEWLIAVSAPSAAAQAQLAPHTIAWWEVYPDREARTSR
jgi:hypothetical protein